MDPYKILNVSKDATDAEIKKSYRKLAGQHHPDKGGDEEKFKLINEAYTKISNPNKRKQHDNSSQQFSGHGDFFGNFNNIFQDIFGGVHHHKRKTRRQKLDQKDDEI